MLDPVLLVAFAAVLAAAAFRAVRDRPPMLFMGAWLSLILAGAVLWVPAGIGPAAVSFLLADLPGGAARRACSRSSTAARRRALGGRRDRARACCASRSPRGFPGSSCGWVSRSSRQRALRPQPSLRAARRAIARAASWLAAAAVIGLAGLADGASAFAREIDGRIPVPLAFGWLAARVGRPPAPAPAPGAPRPGAADRPAPSRRGGAQRVARALPHVHRELVRPDRGARRRASASPT